MQRHKLIMKENMTVNNLNICIIGSESLIAKTLKGFLSDLGHNVHILESVEFKNLSGTKEIDLIIAPDNKAKSLFQKLHEVNPDAMMLILKTNDNSISVQEALRGGVFAFLNMPIKFGELEVTLQRLMEYYYTKRKKFIN